MTQREARVLFSKLYATWLHWAWTEGIDDDEELVLDEGYVAITDGRDGDHDGPHKRGGAHYLGTAHDHVLYRSGKPVASSEDATWKKLGEKWESLHPLCRWGGRWGDANHMGLSYNGRA